MRQAARPVGSMSLNPREPKWFCPDAESTRDYQRSRPATYVSAQPFRRAACCDALIDPDVVVNRGGSSATAWPAAIDSKPKRNGVTVCEAPRWGGIKPIVGRWKYLLIGVENDDAAMELADRIRRKAPAGAVIKAEPSATVAWEVMAKNPFAVFGALGPGPTFR